MSERWVTVLGYNNYVISSIGKVVNSRNNYELKWHMSNSGYAMVSIDNKQHYVHRLVLSSFLNIDLSGKLVNHIDGQKINNELSNLEISTYYDNAVHAYKTGLRTPVKPKKVHLIGTDLYFDSIKQCGDYLNRDYQAVSGAIRRGGKVAGYKAEFVEDLT